MPPSCRFACIAIALIGVHSAFSVARGQAIYEPYTVTSYAGAGPDGSNDGAAAIARFSGPDGVAVDGSENVYVADGANYTLRKITPDGTVSTLAGMAGQRGTTDGQGSAARFGGLRGIAIDSLGNIYVVESSERTIRKVTPSGLVSTYVGPVAGFNYPTSAVLDALGNLYVADSYNHRICKVTANGTVTTFAGTKGAYGNADGVGAAARFYFVSYLAIDGAGNLYAADDNKIRKITPDAVVTTLAGGGYGGTADGTGSGARFGFLQGVAADSAGNVYVCDNGNYTLRKITPDGVTRTLAGLPGDLGDKNGTATQARFGELRGLAIDGSGVLYVAQSYWTEKIRRAIPGGPYPTPAPSPVSTATPFPELTPSPTPTPAPTPPANAYLDAGFRGPRSVSPSRQSRVLVLASGKFLAFGGTETLQNHDGGPIVRYNADGSYDPTFRFDALDAVFAITELPNQQLLVAGYPHWSTPAATSDGANQVLRLNADGSVDPAFSSNAIADDIIGWITVQPDGKILLAGPFRHLSGAARQFMARLLPSGEADNSFSPPALNTGLATSPLVQPDGRILIAGSFTQVNGTARARIVRLNSDGSLDASFAPSGFTNTTSIRGLALLPNGQVVIAGRFTVPASFASNPTGASYTGVPLLRLNTDGTADGTFGSFDSTLFGNNFAAAREVVRDANEKYLALIARSVSPNVALPAVVRFNVDGSVDPTFSRPDLRSFEPGTPDYYGAAAFSIALETSGRILVAGTFNSANNDGIARYGVVRLNEDGTPTAFAPEVAGYRDYPNHVVRFSDGRSWATAYPFLGASFGQYNTFPHNLARLNPDGRFDFSFDLGAAVNDQRFSAYGALALAGDDAFVWGVRGDRETRNYFRLSSDGAVDPGFVFDWAAPPFTDATVLPDGRVLLVAGDDPQANAHAPIVPLASDGSLDRTFQIGPVVLNKIHQRWEGSLSQVNAGTFVVAVMPNGQIVLQFLGADGLFRLARLNSDGSFDASFSDSAFPPSSITTYSSLYLYDPIYGGSDLVAVNMANDPRLRGQPQTDGSIVVVGHFKSFIGINAGGIMRLLPNGAVDESFKAGMGAQWTTIPETSTKFPQIEDIAEVAGGRLLIVGNFEAFNGVNAPGIALLHPDGSIDSTFTPPVRRIMTRNAVGKLFPQADGSVMLAGPYSFAGEEAERSLVRLRFDQSATMTGAASRKTHGDAGVFDIALPLTGNPGVEARRGGANGEHTIVVIFGTNITSGEASVASGAATMSGPPAVSGNTMTIALTNVSDAQTVSLALSNVTTATGHSVPDATLNIGFLIADTTGDRVVNSGDATQTRNRSGQETNSTNLRSDYNTDGFINSADATIVRARSGQFIP